MPKKPHQIMSTRLRLPVGMHQMLKVSAKQNNRSINSEILWGLAHYLGGEAGKYVEHMRAEQRRNMHNVLRMLMSNPEEAAKAIAGWDKATEGET
jgi:hypothetical protein